jgi:predicted transcriptional regulator
LKTMRLSEIAVILEAEVLFGEELDRIEIERACGSDLMSDVLCQSMRGSLLLTGLTNPQVVRTAEMSENSAICFVRGKIPPPETVDLARKNQIPLLLSRFSMYLACGKLFTAGLLGCDEA